MTGNAIFDTIVYNMQHPVITKLQEYTSDKKIRIGTLAYIGEELNLSRERVRQVAKMAGYQMAMETVREDKTVNCYYCGKEFTSKYYNAKFCGDECKKKFSYYKNHEVSICSYCKLGFLNPKSRSNHHTTYCSKTCQGRNLADKYGFSSKTNNRKKRYISKENIIKDFPKPFTIEEFSEKYKYESYGGAYITVSNLVRQGFLKKELLSLQKRNRYSIIKK